MYGIVNGLHKGKAPPKKPAANAKKKPSEPCCRRFGRKLKAFVLRLRAGILIFTAAVGIPAFYMTLHFLVNPGMATLAAQFEPAHCSVVSVRFEDGQNNCRWSSCRQGCTVQEMYHCWKILVRVESSATNDSFGVTNVTESSTLGEANETFPLNTTPLIPMPENGTARLLSSVNGCGYKSCKSWAESYAIGTAFPCNVSSDGTIAVAGADDDKALVQVAIGISPLVLSIVSFCLMYLLYWRKGAKDTTLKLAPDPESRNAKWEQARIEILKNLAKDKKISPMDVGMAFSSGMKSNIKNLKSMAEGVHRVFKVSERKKDQEDEYLQAKKKWADDWRRLAAKASVHPTVSPARRFNQANITLSPDRGLPISD